MVDIDPALAQMNFLLFYPYSSGVKKNVGLVGRRYKVVGSEEKI